MIALILVFVLVTFIVYVKWRQSYWRRRGLPELEPEFFFGHVRNVSSGNKSMPEASLERYKTAKALDKKHAGYYTFLQPGYIPIDPEIIKHILLKDFSHFMNHGVYHHPKDVLSMHLFNIEGDAWKKLRMKLTPTFTSGKMKMMFETLLEKTVGLEKVINGLVDKAEPFPVKDIFARFTTDVIGSCAFGIECNSLEDPQSLFLKNGKQVFAPNRYKLIVLNLFPAWLLGNLGYKNAGREVTNFYTNIVTATLESRRKNNIIRKDFVQLLIELRNQTGDQYHLTDEEIIAQCFVFFLAGFETSSTTMTFAMLELAHNTEIQEKLRSEITTVLAKHNNQITYDAVMEMTYLSKVVNEALRKYPAAASIPRVCNKNYEVPGTNFEIEKGTRVTIPVLGLHRDPEYYPNPDVFDPENFSEERKAKRPDCTFLPFGDGPRQCIGLRFGLLQTKVGLISLLRNFRFTLSKKTPYPVKFKKFGFIPAVEGDVWVDAIRV